MTTRLAGRWKEGWKCLLLQGPHSPPDRVDSSDGDQGRCARACSAGACAAHRRGRSGSCSRSRSALLHRVPRRRTDRVGWEPDKSAHPERYRRPFRDDAAECPPTNRRNRDSRATAGKPGLCPIDEGMTGPAVRRAGPVHEGQPHSERRSDLKCDWAGGHSTAWHRPARPAT